MAVPKTTETRCRNRAYKHCTNIPIPTSIFHAQCHFPVISEQSKKDVMYKKRDLGMGLFVQCWYALSVHIVSVVFGTAIPTSLYIFRKCSLYLYISYPCIITAAPLTYYQYVTHCLYKCTKFHTKVKVS